MTQTNRLLSLDVMRGITIAGMILVNDPGSWQYVYAPLLHSHWNGCTPTDLVFPFFMFIMGISMYFSLSKYKFVWSAENVKKVIKRTIVIFLVGLGLNLFNHIWKYGISNFEHLRILGVMQRLALAYGFGSLIGLSINHRYLLHTSVCILFIYWILLMTTDSMELSPESIIAVIDRAALGETHMYSDTMDNGVIIAFDPEGILSCLSSIAHVLFGFYIGKMIMSCKKNVELITRNIFIFGTILTFAGLLLNYGCPINKKIWSSTFVLTTCGLGSLLLGLLMWMIDIRKMRKWTMFFESFGINSLYLYIQAAVLETLLEVFRDYTYGDVLVSLFGYYGGSLVWAIFFVLLNWIPGYILYKKRIYIKI